MHSGYITLSVCGWCGCLWMVMGCWW